MTETKLVIQDNNQELMEKLRKKYLGKYLIEIAKRGDGNKLYYIIGDSDYEEILWHQDNKLNQDDEFIGSSVSVRL